MRPAWPRYVLFADAIEPPHETWAWRFVLSAVDSHHTLAAQDVEPSAHRERLELLAVLRGLEALDQPSAVTVVCPSRYVRRGIERGLKEWRANGWKWERFGRRVWVRDHDLWQRIDRTLEFHRVECRSWRVDAVASPAADATPNRSVAALQRRSTDARPASRLANEPALLVVRTTATSRRGVIRFDTPQVAAAG